MVMPMDCHNNGIESTKVDAREGGRGVANSVTHMTDYVHVCVFFGYVMLLYACAVKSPIT